MNSSEDLNYIYNHQRLLFQETTKPSEAANVMRQCLLQTYNASLNRLDNRAALELLKINLDKYTEHFEDDNILDRFADVTTMTNNVSAISSNLKDVNINRIMDSLPCNNENSSILCHNANVNEEAVQEFMSLFSYNQDTSNEAKVRKIAKSFAPKSCNQKHKMFKTLSTGSLESKVCGSPNEKLKEPDTTSSSFKTAFEELQLQNQKKIGSSSVSHTNLGSQKRKLGTRRSFRNKFVSPLLSNNLSDDEAVSKNDTFLPDQDVDERLKNIEPRMVELIRSEIMDFGARVVWDDIAGLEFAKTAIQEAVIWPLLRPDIFTGLRKPPKGILLFGPPGTGKTLIGKCIASQSNSTFFSISASSLTSKWIGDGEKMVRALFTVARCHQPAVIFIDEVDSLLSQRNETEHESSRRIKTEFLVQLDGATTDNDERLLVVGATNRPQELDEAARRRFVKRLYIPLPDCEARLQLVTRLMATEKNILNEDNIKEIAQLTNGYSGADIKNLCSEASLGPIRSIDMNLIHCIQTAEVRPVNMDDFLKAVSRVKASVSPNDLNQYLKWNKTFGSDNCL